MKIIHGDFRENLDKIKETDFIITDPPYNQGYHYSSYKDKMGKDEYADMLRSLFKGRKSVVIHYPEEMMMILGGGHIGEVQQVVSWVYPSNTAKQSRLIAWFGCKPDFRKIGQPYKNPKDKRIAKRIAEGKMARGYDWWEINQVKNVSKKDNPHPCPIPYELAKRIIVSTTEIGDRIVDPFCGSGTILQAAKDLGRDYLGFDIDEKYVNYCRKKYE